MENITKLASAYDVKEGDVIDMGHGPATITRKMVSNSGHMVTLSVRWANGVIGTYNVTNDYPVSITK